MTRTDRHIPEPLLLRFGKDPRGLDHTAAASIETHLVSCARCRERLSASEDPDWLAASWDAIADQIDRTRTGLVERWLDRGGLPGGGSRDWSPPRPGCGPWA